MEHGIARRVNAAMTFKVRAVTAAQIHVVVVQIQVVVVQTQAVVAQIRVVVNQTPAVAIPMVILWIKP